jgi:hypothetical protein
MVACALAVTDPQCGGGHAMDPCRVARDDLVRPTGMNGPIEGLRSPMATLVL